MVTRNFRHAYLQEVGLTQFSGDHDLNFFFQHDRFQDILQYIQIPLNSSLKLVEIEIFYIKPYPPLFFHQQHMQWSCYMVHSHFTLCLRVRDYLNNFPTPMAWLILAITITPFVFLNHVITTFKPCVHDRISH